MSDLLKISVGVIGLDAEVNDEIAKIENDIPIALNAVGSEMIKSLQEHIETDWYNAWQPSVYIRRTDVLSYGTPLGSIKNMDVQVLGKRTLDFTYSPTGEYKGPYFEHDRDGDELIESIQTGRLEGEPPPRPFWNNFVEEQKNGAIMNTFSAYMRKHAMVLEGGEKDLQFDGNESMLEAGNVQLKMK